MNLADISKLGVKNPFKQRYDNYIGGRFVPPVNGQPFGEIARSGAGDAEHSALAGNPASAAKTTR